MQNYSGHPMNLPELLMRKRGMLLYLILGVALIAFEAINFSTTQYALIDLLGPLTFAGMRWATILSIAFCGIDFAGIAKLFTPDEGQDDRSREVWYLFVAWMLAATMNAMLTWWGVSMALSQHSIQSTAIIDRKLIMQGVPILVAVMVWVTRVLLIGSFTRAGSNLQAPSEDGYSETWARVRANQRLRQAQQASAAMRTAQQEGAAFQPPMPAPRHVARPQPPVPTTFSAPPISTSRPQAVPPAARPTPLQRPSFPEPHAPRSLEPEYIPEGDSEESNSSIPSLRPLTALSARPNRNNGGDNKF